MTNHISEREALCQEPSAASRPAHELAVKLVPHWPDSPLLREPRVERIEEARIERGDYPSHASSNPHRLMT
jgi:hypothetical protein